MEAFSWFYNLIWGANVTVWVRVLSAPTFFGSIIYFGALK